MTKTFVSVAAVVLVLFLSAALPAAATCQYCGGHFPYTDGHFELPEVPLGETIVLDDVPVCRLPGLLIEA